MSRHGDLVYIEIFRGYTLANMVLFKNVWMPVMVENKIFVDQALDLRRAVLLK